jgi:hypothetical protein
MFDSPPVPTFCLLKDVFMKFGIGGVHQNVVLYLKPVEIFCFPKVAHHAKISDRHKIYILVRF